MIRSRMLHPISPPPLRLKLSKAEPIEEALSDGFISRLAGGKVSVVADMDGNVQFVEGYFCPLCMQWIDSKTTPEHGVCGDCWNATVPWAWDGDHCWEPMTLREVLSEMLWGLVEWPLETSHVVDWGCQDVEVLMIDPGAKP